MDNSVMTSSSLTAEIPDRLTVSCPPETFTSSSDEDVSRTPLPEPYPERIRSPGRHVRCVLDGVVEPFQRQRPERPGETSSTSSSRRDSRDCSTVIEETIEEEEEEVEQPPTDVYGFFLKTNGDKIQSEYQERKPVDIKTIRRREMKWVQMLDNWKYFMDEKYDKVRDRCRKGIPPSMRGRAWKYLCGAAYNMEVSRNRHVFDACVKQEGDPKWLEDIRKDLNRQFPEHELFARTGKFGEGGKEDLYLLLKAWTVLHPDEGYCQGQAPIASVLLMHMPLKDSFYCFVQICHKYLTGYYSAGLEAVQVDGDILVQLLKEKSKVCYKHFKTNSVDPVLYMIEWFMCAFCRTLPWPTVLRVWDMFLCEGVKVLFKVALVLLKESFGTTKQCKQYPDLHAIVTRLRNLPPQIVEEEYLVHKVIEMDLNDGEMERMHYRALKARQMKVKHR